MRRTSVLGQFWISVILALVIIGLLVLARVAGNGTARSDFLAQRANDYAAYPRVAITLKKDAIEAIGDRFADIPWTTCGRLLLTSGGRMFLIRPIGSAPAANLDSFVLAADQVEALRITSEYRSCP